MSDWLLVSERCVLLLNAPPPVRSIHDHANSHCFMRVMDGSLQEVQYAWPDSSQSGNQPITELTTRDLLTDEVTYINGKYDLFPSIMSAFFPGLRFPGAASYPEHQPH